MLGEMRRDTTRSWQPALAKHRKAVGEVLSVLESIPDERWGESLAAGKWTVAQLAEHLALSYETALDSLQGGPGMRLVLPWWRIRLLRLTVLRRILDGRGFPAGAPAPRELRPGKKPLGRSEGLLRLRTRADEAERALTSASAAVRLPHAYFGKLRPREILGVQAAHLDHHRAQLEAWRLTF